MSDLDIKSKIEKILSDILSDKHDCKITVKFNETKGQDIDGDYDTTEFIDKE